MKHAACAISVVKMESGAETIKFFERNIVTNIQVYTIKLWLKVLSRVQCCASLEYSICLLLSICLMSWKITCIQMVAVGVQLIHCGGEKWFTIAQIKESAAIRAKLTSLLRTPSCHLHQRNFKNSLPCFRKHLIRAELVWNCPRSKIYRGHNQTFCYFSRAR